jgi:hypothetical protein
MYQGYTKKDDKTESGKTGRGSNEPKGNKSEPKFERKVTKESKCKNIYTRGRHGRQVMKTDGCKAKLLASPHGKDT